MLLFKNKGTRIAIFIMAILVIVVIVFAKIYYGNKNKAKDPRIKKALVLYGNYNNYIKEHGYQDVLLLLDTIEQVYKEVGHYSNSYEMGVINNNRGAVNLTIALHECDSGKTRNHYLERAETYFKKSIDIYTNWMDEYGGLEEHEVRKKIQPAFSEQQPALKEHDIQRIWQNRVDEILLAQDETPRRMSVCYTNLGIINRHYCKFEEALACYEKALSLWDDNHTAKNNLNILLGRPVEKQNLLRKLFPPERED